MTDITFQCTNPSCGHQISFSDQAAGSLQVCPYCGQKVIVPGIVPGATSGPLTVSPQRTEYQTISSAYTQQERTRAERSKRTVKPGIGCFAMLAVMFAVGLIGWGIGNVADVAPRQLQGWTMLMAGLGGVVAFGLFGYYLTDTEQHSSDQGRR